MTPTDMHQSDLPALHAARPLQDPEGRRGPFQQSTPAHRVRMAGAGFNATRAALTLWLSLILYALAGPATAAPIGHSFTVSMDGSLTQAQWDSYAQQQATDSGNLDLSLFSVTGGTASVSFSLPTLTDGVYAGGVDDFPYALLPLFVGQEVYGGFDFPLILSSQAEVDLYTDASLAELALSIQFVTMTVNYPDGFPEASRSFTDLSGDTLYIFAITDGQLVEFMFFHNVALVTEADQDNDFSNDEAIAFWSTGLNADGLPSYLTDTVRGVVVAGTALQGVGQVPAPGPLWLLGAGLGLVGFSRRPR